MSDQTSVPPLDWGATANDVVSKIRDRVAYNQDLLTSGNYDAGALLDDIGWFWQRVADGVAGVADYWSEKLSQEGT
jgi:hypothetical protein